MCCSLLGSLALWEPRAGDRRAQVQTRGGAEGRQPQGEDHLDLHQVRPRLQVLRDHVRRPRHRHGISPHKPYS